MTGSSSHREEDTGPSIIETNKHGHTRTFIDTAALNRGHLGRWITVNGQAVVNARDRR